MKSEALIFMDRARQELAKVTKIEEAKGIRDKAEVLRIYAKKIGKGLEVQNQCAEIKIRVERKAGELIPKQIITGGDPKSHDVTLKDLNISKMQSSRWQLIASIPEKQFEKHLAKIKATLEELTSSGFLNLARRIKPKILIDPPEGKYNVIYADPPWQYGDKLIEGYGAAEHHYSTLSIEELCELPIADLSADNSILFLWVTFPLLDECFEIIEAWGFEYKTGMVWDKVKHNFGHWFSMRSELLLICEKGSYKPDISKIGLIDNVKSIERTRTHSEKPEYFRKIIDKMYPGGKKIELFARDISRLKLRYPHWDFWGAL